MLGNLIDRDKRIFPIQGRISKQSAAIRPLVDSLEHVRVLWQVGPQLPQAVDNHTRLTWRRELHRDE